MSDALEKMIAESELKFAAAETLGQDLLGLLVQEFKAMPDVWQKLPEYSQNEVIERARERVESAVRIAVQTIFTEGRTAVVADLEAVNFKDKVEAKIIVSNLNTDDVMFSLQKSRGGPCLIVLADHKRFTGGMEEIRGEPDQRGLGLGEEYDEAPRARRNKRSHME